MFKNILREGRATISVHKVRDTLFHFTGILRFSSCFPPNFGKCHLFFQNVCIQIQLTLYAGLFPKIGSCWSGAGLACHPAWSSWLTSIPASKTQHMLDLLVTSSAGCSSSVIQCLRCKQSHSKCFHVYNTNIAICLLFNTSREPTLVFLDRKSVV